jgi:hypothetical protein
MRILALVSRRSLFAFAIVAAIAAIMSAGCSMAENKEKPASPPKATPRPAAANHSAASARPTAKTQPSPKAVTKAPSKREPPEEKLTEEVEEIAEKPRDLGPPLVDHPGNLKRLDPEQRVWIDLVAKQVVLQGEVCKAGYPLEFFATYSNRSYEAVLAVNVKPSIVHAGLLAIGATPGHPARFQPEFVPPEGAEVAIQCRWKDAKGKLQSAPAQHWIRNIKTRKELESNWIFGGSMFVTDDATGKKYYQADSGELICVLSLPTAMLDLPMRGYGAIEARQYEAFEEHLPPPGTPVTLLLKPVLASKPTAEPPAKSTNDDQGRHVEAEKQALAAAQPWLDLVDRGEYSKSYDEAAAYFKDGAERHTFIKLQRNTRESLGKLVSRELQSQDYSVGLPNAPAARCVTIKYDSSFARRKSVEENVVVMLDKNNKWRVAGYWIK